MSAIASQNETLQQHVTLMQQQVNAVNLVQQAQRIPPYIPPPQRAMHYPAPVQHYQPPAPPYMTHQTPPTYPPTPYQPVYGFGGIQPGRGGRCRGRGRGAQRAPQQQMVSYVQS